MVKYLRLLPLLILFSLASVNAQNISVSVSTDTSTYNVGDYIKLHLELKYGKEIKPEIPPVKDSVKVLEFIQTLPVDSSMVDSRIVKKYTFVFSKYDSAQVTIPSLKVFYTEGSDTTKKFIATTPLTILVKTLTVNAQEDIKDIKEPMKLPIDWLFVLLIVFIILVLVAAGYFGYRYYRKKKLLKENLVPEVILPPYEIALNELHALEDKQLWQQGKVKEYHSELTGIVRKYFEYRFNFKALEMTSAEILAVLSYIEEGKKVVNTAQDFFSNADLVKFAKFQPMPSVNNEMMKQGYEMVNQTIPVAQPAAPEEEDKVG
jgi:hypothetical protein